MRFTKLFLLFAIFFAVASFSSAAGWFGEDGEEEKKDSASDTVGDVAAEAAEESSDAEEADSVSTEETEEEKQKREDAALLEKYKAEYEEKLAAYELEIKDPKYSLEPMKLHADLVCSACDHVTSRLGNAVLSVVYEVKDKPLKERRQISNAIVDSVCGGLVDASIVGEGANQRFLLHTNNLKFDLETLALKKKKRRTTTKKKEKKVEAEEESDEEKETADGEKTEEDADKVESNTAEAGEETKGEEEETLSEQDGKEEEEEEVVDDSVPEPKGNEVDTNQLQKICKYLLASHASKLKTNIAGFYKDINSSSLKKKLCYQWTDVCIPPQRTKLSKREKCLLKVYKGVNSLAFDDVEKYIDCAQAELKVKKVKKKEDKKMSDKGDGEEAQKEEEGTTDTTVPEDTTTSAEAEK
eukprot:g2668.t1